MHCCLEDKWRLDLCPPPPPLQKSQSSHLFLSLVLPTTLNNHSSPVLILPSSNQPIFQCLFFSSFKPLSCSIPTKFSIFPPLSSSSHSANPNFLSMIHLFLSCWSCPLGQGGIIFSFYFHSFILEIHLQVLKCFNFTVYKSPQLLLC